VLWVTPRNLPRLWGFAQPFNGIATLGLQEIYEPKGRDIIQYK
jgi:hypothetical protein